MPALRLLHTSDWHLGALFHDQPRDDEEQRALDGIVALARDAAVDVVVIAGDCFDGPNPPAAAQARWFSTLLRLRTEAGVGTVLAIGGNHDHGLRLDAPGPFMAMAGVHLRGHLPLDRPAAEVVVPVRDRQGRVAAAAALVPYLRDGDVALAALGDALADQARRQADGLHARYTAIQAALATAAAGLPRIVVAHTFAAGGSVGGSERPVLGEQIVGRLSQCRIDALAEGAAYVALGHLHRPQTVGAQPHWRYCGSLLPMAMDETDTPRQVVIADLPADGGPAQIEIRAIPSPRAYARLAGPVPEVQAAIRRLPPPAAGELVPWCDLTLEADLLDPGLLRDLGDAVEAQGWKTLAIRRRQTAVAGADLLAPGAADAADPLPPSLTPEAIFVAVAASQGVAADDDLRADFAALLAEVQAQGQGV